MDPPTPELMEYNKELKKSILDDLFRKTTSFFIHCTPHPDLVLGSRGLINNEKTEGIVLIFGPYSTRNLTWDDDSIYCEMQFGTQWQQVVIPYLCISRMYDKDGQFLMHWTAYNANPADTSKKFGGPERTSRSEKLIKKKSSESNVISVDFGARKKPSSEEEPEQ